MRVNVVGTYNALEAALATKETLERFVDFSTSEVFGTHAFNVSEGQVSTIGSVGEARWTYAVSKLAGEHMAHAYHDELGLPTVTVHPFNVYGPGQIGGGAIRAFIEAALAGRDLVIHGDGSQIRAWCYVDDMVEGTLLCLERPEAVGQAFNVGNPRSTVTIFDLAQRIKRLTGAPGEIVFQPLALRRRRAAHPERREGARAARLRGAGRPRRRPREDDRVVQGTGARIRLAWPDVGAEELAEVAGVLASGQLTMGPKVARARGRARAGVRGRARGRRLVGHGCAAPCRARARESGRATRLLVPAYTFPATANVVALVGARPVLVDVDPETMNLDPAKVDVRPADEGDPRGAPVRPAGAARGAAGRAAGRGRGRRARRASRAAARAAGSACSAASPSTRARSSRRARAAR